MTRKIKTRRVTWIDDGFEFFEEVQANWKTDGAKNTNLEKVPLEFALNENGQHLGKLLDAPPDVLVLDWAEGKCITVLNALHKLVQDIVLVSLNTSASLSLDEDFKKWSRPPNRFLTKPFSAAQLASVIGNPKEYTDENDSLEKLLAIRYLDENLQPVGKSLAWKLDLNRPVLEWDEQQRRDLKDGKQEQINILSFSPTEPDKFCPVQFITQALPENQVGGSNVRYIQQGIELADGLALAQFGKSIAKIIKMMQTAGFPRGRYYHLTDIAGRKGYSLEMIAREPYDSGQLDIPAAVELDEQEYKTYADYCKELTETPSKQKLVHLLVPPGIHADGKNSEFWKKCINMDDIPNVLRVPVFLSDEEFKNREDIPGFENIKSFRGEFIFDKGPGSKIEGKHVNAIERSLLAAIKYFASARKREHENYVLQANSMLLGFHKSLSQKTNVLEIETALTEKIIDIAALYNKNNKSHQEDSANSSSVVRSAMYARYHIQREHLKVSYESEALMSDFTFSMNEKDFDIFHVVQCAKKAIDAIKDGKKCVPHYGYNMDFKSRENILRKIPECTEEKIKQIMNRLNGHVKTLAAYPLNMGGKLLGVIVIRSSRSFAFDSRTVETSQKAIEIALPFLARLYEIERQRVWSGLIMHEMRANLTWSRNKADLAMHAATIEEKNEMLRVLKVILESGIDISSMFMQWMGMNEEDVQNKPTSEEFWKRVNAYGQLMADTLQNRTWHSVAIPPWHANSEIQARHSVLLERALHILIDNAFRYGKLGMPINFATAVENNHFFIEVTNCAESLEMAEKLIRIQKTTASNDWLPGSKAEIGLTLVQMLCHTVGAPPITITHYHTPQNDYFINAKIQWPKI